MILKAWFPKELPEHFLAVQVRDDNGVLVQGISNRGKLWSVVDGKSDRLIPAPEEPKRK